MITGQGHDHSVDWWALGILMYLFTLNCSYEMIVGVQPFFNKNKH